ncbi:MAG: hypothetical protein EOP47_03225 [Sphingobacteriaceae bacterium]|nr:MAG: hypothetical protein EOP47_03225 [Sphingobacteriaceae bacterium]
MKLTEEQLVVLQDTLNDHIKYKETYEEVYDHVLTALEQVDNTVPLGEAINTIMLNDFGGFKGLKKIESDRWWMMTRQMVAKLSGYMIDYLKLPLLPITVIIYALIYYFVVELQFSPGHMLISMPWILMMPLCGGYWYFKTGFRTKSIGKSIRYQPIQIIGYAPLYIFGGSFFILEIIFHKILKVGSILNFSLPPMAVSLLLTLLIIYNISFFRLYKHELVASEIK